MKRHILRAPATDRYLLDVPTKLSDLEDDTHPVLSLVVKAPFDVLSGVTENVPADSGTITSGVSSRTWSYGVTESINQGGWTVSGSGNLTITVPQTGIYQIGVTAAVINLTDTPNSTGLAYSSDPLQAVLSVDEVAIVLGAGLFTPNKLGSAYAMGSGGSPAYSPNASQLVSLAAGETISPTLEVVTTSSAGTFGLALIIELWRVA